MQKKYDLRRYQNERDEARRLQRSGNSRRVKKEIALQYPFSSESCRSSTMDHVEEMTLEFPKKKKAGGASGDGGDFVESDKRKRRRCMEAGTTRRNRDARNQSRIGRAGKHQRGPLW